LYFVQIEGDFATHHLEVGESGGPDGVHDRPTLFDDVQILRSKACYAQEQGRDGGRQIAAHQSVPERLVSSAGQIYDSIYQLPEHMAARLFLSSGVSRGNWHAAIRGRLWIDMGFDRDAECERASQRLG
jgi:hypothetical protein